jgi:hypothetical protein
MQARSMKIAERPPEHAPQAGTEQQGNGGKALAERKGWLAVLVNIGGPIWKKAISILPHCPA